MSYGRHTDGYIFLLKLSGVKVEFLLSDCAPVTKKCKAIRKIISIEEARAAARAGRRRADHGKPSADIPSLHKVNNFERWLKETHSEISKE
jgi:hypothetical protein